VATSIDDNEADEKSDKPRCQLINIRCTSAMQNFDGNAVALSRNFNNALARNGLLI